MADTVLDVQHTVIKLPPGAITDKWFSATSGDELGVRKQRHRLRAVLPLPDGTDVTTISKVVHTAGGKGKVTAIEVVPGETAPDGDKQWTADVLKSTGAGAFASILDTAEVIDSNSTALTRQTTTIDGKTYRNGDAFQVVVTASGASGNQGQGGCVIIWFDEEPG